jgi:hypothetical protein
MTAATTRARPRAAAAEKSAGATTQTQAAANTPPANLAALRAITDPADRALAAAGYILQREQAIEAARGIRDAAIAALLPEFGVTETARRTGVSVTTVKLVRKLAGKSS